MNYADKAAVAEAAIWTVRLGGAALTLAIAGAMVEAMFPGVQNAVGARVWDGLVSAFSVALRVFYLVMAGLPILAYRLAVTYGHVGARSARHTYVTRGRHRPEYVKTHHASAWQAREAVTA